MQVNHLAPALLSVLLLPSLLRGAPSRIIMVNSIVSNFLLDKGHITAIRSEHDSTKDAQECQPKSPGHLNSLSVPGCSGSLPTTVFNKHQIAKKLTVIQ